MPLHITFSGSAATAGRFVGLGKLMVSSIKATVRKEGTSVMVLSGVSIEARVVGLQEYVHIEVVPEECSLYVESGFAKPGEYIHGRVGASDPARVFLGNTSPEATLFGTLVVGSLSATIPKSVSGKTLFNYDTDPPSQLPGKTVFASGEYSPEAYFGTPMSHTTGEFPVNTRLEEKKTIMLKIAPSIYSGKMRLFVQSQLGAPFEIFESQNIGVSEEGLPKFFIQSGTTFGYSHGIYTSDDGSYWLLGLGTKVVVTRIKLTPCAEKLSRWLLAHPQSPRSLQSAFEAYIFAGAVLDHSFSFSLNDIPSIEPIAYGWKFNWNGREAKCISAQRQDTWWTFSECSVAINRNSTMEITDDGLSELQKERLRWGVSSTELVLSQANFPSNKFIWAPVSTEQGIETVRWNFIPGLPPPMYASTAVYGWFDDYDVFKTVSIEYGEEEAVAEATHDSFPPGGYVYAGLNVTYEASTGTRQTDIVRIGDAAVEVVTSSMDVEKGTFTAQLGDDTGGYGGSPSSWNPWDGVVWTIDEPPHTSDSGTVATLREKSADNVTSRTEYETAVEPDLACYQNTFAWWCQGLYTISDLGSTYTRDLISSHETVSTVTAIVIPTLDAESVYVFTKKVSNDAPSGRVSGAGATDYGFLGYIVGDKLNTETGVWSYITYGGFKNVLGVEDCPTTYTPPPDATTEEVIEAEWYNKSADSLAAVIDNNGGDLFDSDPLNQILNMGNQCTTRTSAVFNYVTGSNIAPSHDDFEHGYGTFIGWF